VIDGINILLGVKVGSIVDFKVSVAVFVDGIDLLLRSLVLFGTTNVDSLTSLQLDIENRIMNRVSVLMILFIFSSCA